MRKRGHRSLIGSAAVAIALSIGALTPAGAYAITITLTPASGGTYEIHLDDNIGTVDQVALTTVTPSGGMPDLVIGDITAGISDPIPSPCQRVSQIGIRCPLGMIMRVSGNLGSGNDTWGFGVTQDLDNAAIQLYKAYMGPGDDVYEGGPAANEVHGGPGRDEIQGGPKGDFLYGGAQNDFSVGLGGNDLFRCGKGRHDRFNDGPGKDRVDLGSCEFRVHTIF
jgi:Ca2+-binding RTX toxin-like protein